MISTGLGALKIWKFSDSNYHVLSIQKLIHTLETRDDFKPELEQSIIRHELVRNRSVREDVDHITDYGPVTVISHQILTAVNY